MRIFWSQVGDRVASVAEEFDYDTDPDRFRTNVQVVERYGLLGDVHTEVAARTGREQLWPLLDMGCGEGRLREAVGNTDRLIATDLSITMLSNALFPKLCSDMTQLPFRDGCFASAAALWCLYHVAEPRLAIQEAYRVLRPGGVFVTCAPSLHNDPEMAHLFDAPTPSTFDSEFAPDLVAEGFDDVEVDRWDMPAVTLPDTEAVTMYLRGRRMAEAQEAETATSIETPVTLTKRGALVWAYKSG